MEQLQLELLPKDGEKVLEALKSGCLVVVRSKNDFMYVLLRKKQFQMFMHSPGSESGGRNQFPEDDKYTAIVKNFANLADMCVVVHYDAAQMNLFHVMASAEEAILTEFPGDDRDADEAVDFTPPTERSTDDT
ncbi:MAG: hypothetical protein LBC38_03805 [Oscillospiraceae bacterium]|jgi:hypothetical protein|nr:hypothetical protein [Oscillospiraceae bacterium]